MSKIINPLVGLMLLAIIIASAIKIAEANTTYQYNDNGTITVTTVTTIPGVKPSDNSGANNNSGNNSGDLCYAIGPNLEQARVNFANACGAIDSDCDPAEQYTSGYPHNTHFCVDKKIGVENTIDKILQLEGVASNSGQDNSNNQNTGSSVGRINENDVVFLNFDVAPDRDDIMAMVADKAIADHYGLVPYTVLGTHGHARRGDFQTASESLYNAVWPSGMNAYRDWQGSANNVAQIITDAVANGGKAWIADGGPSDFTADVLRLVPQQYRKSVNVIQHSARGEWNEQNTHPNNLTYVKSQANYISIPNGNIGGNGTADLQYLNGSTSSEFRRLARQSQYANYWNQAFNLMPNRDDFSDSVEFLWLVNDTSISDVISFAKKYF